MQVVGSGVFGVGLYVCFDKDIDDYVEGADLQYYRDATGFLMGGACLVMLTSFIGCCGAYNRSRCLIIFVIFLLLFHLKSK